MIGPATLLLLVALGGANASPCQASQELFQTAIEGLRADLAAYKQCIDRSNGRDDCSTEYADLDLAQDRYETAVAELAKRCR